MKIDKTFGAGQRFRITIKRDFGRNGFWIGGRWVRQGFVVTRGGANIMPGATWFRTVADAMRAIRIWTEAETVDEFWTRLRSGSDRAPI